jgi:hypothetical protein
LIEAIIDEQGADNPIMLPESDSRIRINRTAFVIYNHKDIQDARRFCRDFGLFEVESRGEETFYCGYGKDPFVYWLRQAKQGQPSSFGGAAYVVEHHDELIKAARIPGATQIKPFEAPGGGEIVSVKDPLGFYIHFVHGQEQRETEVAKKEIERAVEQLKGESHKVNYEKNKPRKGSFLRLQPGPAPVHKFGHYGITYPDGRHDDILDFYTKHFALAPSDQLSRDGKKIVTFFHIDRGLEYTDHHCFFIKPAKPQDVPSVAHSAFEVHDFDTQHLGHQHLQQKGYELCWGVGRHILGSQVFDYWFDTSKFVVEHYCDGDLVNCETQVSQGKAGPDSLKIWGPPVPTVF